jgi:protein subunit release factor B
MTSFGISATKARELHDKMRDLNIFEKDIEEIFTRSSGPGGQNVNKVSTCVILRHLPTGIQVRSQQERSQGLNRYKARCQLVHKIEQKQKSRQQKIIHDLEKKKRQNRKRPRALKEKILEGKRQQSQTKISRRKVSVHNIGEH